MKRKITKIELVVFIAMMFFLSSTIISLGMINIDDGKDMEIKLIKNDKIVLASFYASGKFIIEGRVKDTLVDSCNSVNMQLPTGWHSIDFGGMGTAISMWHETSAAFVPSPPGSLPILCCGHEAGQNVGYYDAGHYDNIVASFPDFDICPCDFLNIPATCPNFDMIGKMNYMIHDDDVVVPVLCVDTCPDPTWIRLASASCSGSTSPNTWIDFSFEDWLSPYLPFYGPHLINVLDQTCSLFGLGCKDILGIGFALKGDGGDTVGLTPPGYMGTWSGLLLDNVSLMLSYETTGTVDGKCIFAAWGKPGSRTAGYIPFPYSYNFEYGPSGFLSAIGGTPVCIDPTYHNHLRFDRTEGTITPNGGFCIGVNIPIGSDMLSNGRLPLFGSLNSIDITGASYKTLYT